MPARRGSSRTSWASRPPTAPTRRSSPTRTWTPSTSRCRTISIPSGRSRRPGPASTSCARSRWRMTAADAERMVEACAAEGVRLMEAFMYRLHPSWVAAMDVVASGRIGRLRAVDSWFSYYNDDPANIRNQLDAGGGALFDIGCYSVNLSRMVFGAEPAAVKASIRRDPSSGVDTLTSAHPRVRRGHRDLHLLDPGRDRPAGRRVRDRRPPVDRHPVQHPARSADPRAGHRRRRSAGRAGRPRR